ncbi:MAG: hypothetical protein HY331_12935 [Chloroflexi bacterium]|nr:hypothetical protein [Chloroflexota bacterium]
MATTVAPARTDRFGNFIDPDLGYARGSVLASLSDDVARMHHGRAIIRDRMQRLGRDSVYDLTGLPRAFPLSAEDVENLQSQLTFYAYLDGRAEPLAVQHTGGNALEHDAVILSRVSVAPLAIAIAYLRSGDRMLSVVPRGRSHPSISRAVAAVGAPFREVVGTEAFADALRQERPRVVTITTVTPQKFVTPLEELRAQIALAHEAGAIVFVDDAHMVTRTVHYGQPKPFELGPVDLAVCSGDKHVFGPRAGILVGKRDRIRDVRGLVYQLGLEAPFAHYAAVVRGLEQFDPAPVRRAGELARHLLARAQRRYDIDRVYEAGPGIAINEDDAVDIVRERAPGRAVRLVPMEVTSAICLSMTASHGISLIQTVGMPGCAAPLRIMMFPDGERRGIDAVEEALDGALARVAEVLDQPAAARRIICGPS